MKPGRTKTSRETSHAALGSADGIGILAIRKTSMPLRKNHRTSELIQIQGLRENSGSFPGIDLAAGKNLPPGSWPARGRRQGWQPFRARFPRNPVGIARSGRPPRQFRRGRPSFLETSMEAPGPANSRPKPASRSCRPGLSALRDRQFRVQMQPYHRSLTAQPPNVVVQVYALACKQFVILDWRLDAPQDRRIDLGYPGSGNLGPHRHRCLAHHDVGGADRSLLVPARHDRPVRPKVRPGGIDNQISTQQHKKRACKPYRPRQEAL
jgi:hypothetical protein